MGTWLKVLFQDQQLFPVDTHIRQRRKPLLTGRLGFQHVDSALSTRIRGRFGFPATPNGSNRDRFGFPATPDPSISEFLVANADRKYLSWRNLRPSPPRPTYLEKYLPWQLLRHSRPSKRKPSKPFAVAVNQMGVSFVCWLYKSSISDCPKVILLIFWLIFQMGFIATSACYMYWAVLAFAHATFQKMKFWGRSSPPPKPSLVVYYLKKVSEIVGKICVVAHVVCQKIAMLPKWMYLLAAMAMLFWVFWFIMRIRDV